jgi:P4 family phage/plasmid primase-like protien
LFAKLFKIGYRDKLAYSGKYWYKLNEGGLFRKLEEDADVIIGIEMKGFCTEKLLDLVAETTDDDKRKHLYQALAQFENYKFKMNCISASREAFHQPNLADELDRNRYLLGFDNGVYDLQAEQFRVATIDEKVSKSVGYAYDGEKNTEIQIFEDLIDGYFSSPQKARWFKKHLGSLICGGNPEEKAYFWTGYGRNGKGTIEGLLSRALGEYFVTVKRELYTERGKKSGAEPEMLQLRNARVGMTAETEGDQKFISSIFKSITGNDKISARTLYSSKMVEFESSHKTIIQTNHLPQFTEVSVGLLQRVIAIVFDYQFLDSDTFNPSNPEHKLGDHQLKEKLEKHSEGFIHFLIKWFKVYKREKLNDVPDEIQESIREYRNQIDTVGSFVKLALFHTGDEKHIIKSEELRARYNAWATTNHLSDVEFGKRLRAVGIVPKRQGKDKRNAIKGYVFEKEYEEEFQEANRQGGFGADY